MTDHSDKPAQSRVVDLPGGRFHYLSWGAEQTALPSCVLLHGIVSSALSWVRVGPALAEHYRVYALDMRGHGDSIKPPVGAYSLHDTANDAAAFIEALELEQPVLIGHSWGGATALVLAGESTLERATPLFSRLILEDPAYNFGRSDAEKRAASYTKDIGRTDAALRGDLIADNPGWVEADIDGKIDALSKVSREAVVSVFEQAGQEGNILPLLARVTVPTLLLRADPDLGTVLSEKAWDEARSYLPAHSQPLQIDGATHNIHRSKFEAFMQAVNDFLSEGFDS